MKPVVDLRGAAAQRLTEPNAEATHAKEITNYISVITP